MSDPHFVFLGEVGFPVGFGAIQRQLLIARGLVENGAQVTVISFKGNHGKEQDFPPTGACEGVGYHYAGGSIHKPAGFLRRNWMKVLGRLKEFQYIRELKRQGNLRACFVSTDKFQRILLYRLWCIWLNLPLVLNYDELMSAIPPASRLQRWNDRLFDRLAVRLSDGVTPISEYIKAHARSLKPGVPVFKLPILCDFSKFEGAALETGEISFTYCGAASYRELIEFVLQAFDLLEVRAEAIYLDFILGGSPGALAWVRERIAGTKNHANIRLSVNVPHQQIPAHYAKASALLIPMRPTIQDAARFPHKFGEYLASGRPVITTAYGEVTHYDFLDEKTALIAPTYDTAAFAGKMQFVIDHPGQARAIGQAGRKMGMDNFNYLQIGSGLNEFLLSLSTSQSSRKALA